MRLCDVKVCPKPDGGFTIKLPDGRWLNIDWYEERTLSIAEILQYYGFTLSDERVEVHQDGKKVGTLPGDFDPTSVGSRSFMYEPRPGDFKFRDGAVHAAAMLGPGDLDAVPGFVREPNIYNEELNNAT